MSWTAEQAAETEGKEQYPTEIGSRGESRIVADVIYGAFEVSEDHVDLSKQKPELTIPRVPSAPMNKFVRSGPAELFLALDRVVMTSPEGSTAVKDKKQPCLAVPYLTAFVPLHPVEIIPPMVAPGPGSKGKNRFESCFERKSLIVSHFAPASTTMSAS